MIERTSETGSTSHLVSVRSDIRGNAGMRKNLHPPLRDEAGRECASPSSDIDRETVIGYDKGKLGVREINCPRLQVFERAEERVGNLDIVALRVVVEKDEGFHSRGECEIDTDDSG